MYHLVIKSSHVMHVDDATLLYDIRYSTTQHLEQPFEKSISLQKNLRN